MISENWPLPISKEQQMRAGRGPLKFPSGWQRTHLPGDSQLLWLPSQGSLLAGETDVYLKDKWNWGHTQDPEKFIPGYIVLLRAPPAPLNPFIISLTSPVCLLSLFLSEKAKKQRSVSLSFKGYFSHCLVTHLQPSLLFVYCCVISAGSMTDTPGEKKMVHLFVGM